MTEQEIQQDDTTQNENPDSSSFWSPTAIFLGGVNYAALNWLRMGKKPKAMFFLIVFNVCAFLSRWFTAGNPVGADFELKQTVLWINYAALLCFQIFLALLIRYDLRKFEESGETPVSTPWTVVVRYLGVYLIFVVGFGYCLFDLPTVFGYCGVPRFQDVAYQTNLANRSGLEKLFLSRTDFDCNGWLWTSESIKTENISEKFLQEENISGVLQANTYHLNGDYGKSPKWTDFMGVYQTVFVLAQPVTSERFALLVDDYRDPTLWSVLDTSKYDLHGIWIEARCRDYEELGNRCDIYLADQSIVVKLLFIWNGDINMNELIKKATEKTAYRMSQYNQSP